MTNDCQHWDAFIIQQQDNEIRMLREDLARSRKRYNELRPKIAMLKLALDNIDSKFYFRREEVV